MSINFGATIPMANLQILLDFNNTRCYPGTGTTFSNLVGSASGGNGYLKGSVTNTTKNGNTVLQPNGDQTGVANYVGDRIDIDTSAGGVDRFSKDNSFTHMFWVNLISGSGKLFSTGSAGATGTDNCIWQMWISNGTYYWWNTSGGGANNISAGFTPIDTGTFYLIAVTFESGGAGGTNYARVYIDGELAGTGSIAYNTHSAIDRSGQSNIQWTLGGGYNSSCVNTNVVAQYGMYALYNRKLESDEILKVYNATKGKYK